MESDKIDSKHSLVKLRMFYLNFLLLLNFVISSVDIYRPTVLMHGIASTKEELKPIQQHLEATGIKVYNIEIGNGKLDSIFKSMHWQVSQLCQTIYRIPALKNGFNFIGISQGGLLARGYVEMCNRYPVKNLITWGTPHQGVFGLSDFTIDSPKMYTRFSQEHFSFSNYWKEPNYYDVYLMGATYLPYLNNEVEHDDSDRFRHNMESLENFVMVWSKNDGVITPPESCAFSFIIDLKDTDQYKENWIGLRTLDESQRLYVYHTECTHVSFKSSCLETMINTTIPYLKREFLEVKE